MTHEEIEIAFKKRLLVTIQESMTLPDLKGGAWVITRFGTWYNEKMKSFEDYVCVKDPNNPRTIYEIDAGLIMPIPGVELIIKKIIAERTKAISAQCAELAQQIV